MIQNSSKLLTLSKLLGLGLTLLMQIETSPAAAKWFDEKYTHQSKPISTEGLKSLAMKSPRSSFESFLDPILITRVSGTPGNQKVKEFIIDQMNRLGWNIETDAFTDNTPHGPKPFENIIATLNPDVPRRLVLACHYDSKYTREYDFVGATDSAVPCAMLLHLASALEPELNEHKNRDHQNVTLQFIFFDGEEAFVQWNERDSIYGARHLAQKWESQPYRMENSREDTNYLHRMDMMVLLDLLGTPNPKFNNFFESTSHWHKLLVDIEKALKRNRLWNGPTDKAHFQNRRSYGGIEDDHIPFLHRNVDILHVIPSPFPKVWHTANDNREALDFPTIDNLNKVFRTFVASYLHLGDSS